MSNELSKLLTLEELRDHLQVSRATVFRLKDQGMPAVKVGGSLRFDPAEVQRWIQAQSAEAQITIPREGESVRVPRVTHVIWQEVGGRLEAEYGTGFARITKDGERWFYEINDLAKNHESCLGHTDTEQQAITLDTDILIQWAQEARREQ